MLVFPKSESLTADYMVQCSKKTTERAPARDTPAKNAYLTMDYRKLAAAINAAFGAAFSAAWTACGIQWSIYRRRGSPYLWHLAAPGP
jgi:hypothetical protein